MFCPNCGTKNRDEAAFCENCGTPLSEYHVSGSGTAEAESAVHPENSEQSSTGVPAYPDQHSMHESAPQQTVYGTEQRQYQETGRAGYNTQYTDAQRVSGQTEYRQHTEAGGAHRASGPNKTPLIIAAAVAAVLVIAAGAFVVTKVLPDKDMKYVEASDGFEEAPEQETEAAAEEENEETTAAEETTASDKYEVTNTPDSFLGKRGNVNVCRNISQVTAYDHEIADYSVYIRHEDASATYEYYMSGYYGPGTYTLLDDDPDDEPLSGYIECSGICKYTAADNVVHTFETNFDAYLFFDREGRLWVYDLQTTFDPDHYITYMPDSDVYITFVADEDPKHVEEPEKRFIVDQSIFPSFNEDQIDFTYADSLYGAEFENKTLLVPDEIGESSHIVQEGGYDNTGRSAFDGDITTSWQVDQNNGINETLYCTYNEVKDVDAICLYLGNRRSDDLYEENDRPKTMLIRLWDRQKNDFTDICVTFPEAKEDFALILPYTIKADEIDFQILDYYPGTVYSDNCISEISVYSK